MPRSGRVAVLDADGACPRLPIVVGGGEALAVVWPRMGAEMRSMNRIRLDAGSATVRLKHPMEAVYYVIAGTGSAIDPDTGEAEALMAGSMIHIEPGTAYSFAADRAEKIELIGGPCPVDHALYDSLA